MGMFTSPLVLANDKMSVFVFLLQNTNTSPLILTNTHTQSKQNCIRFLTWLNVMISNKC